MLHTNSSGTLWKITDPASNKKVSDDQPLYSGNSTKLKIIQFISPYNKGAK